MAERETTVIERMAAARWKSMEGLIKPFQSPWHELEEARQKSECETMLAAVRELIIVSQMPGYRGEYPTLVAEWLEDCIDDHNERRAGGKGE